MLYQLDHRIRLNCRLSPVNSQNSFMAPALDAATGWLDFLGPQVAYPTPAMSVTARYDTLLSFPNCRPRG